MKNLFSFSLMMMLISANASAAIYGKDSRRDAYQARSLQKEMSAVAVMVQTALITPNPDGTYFVDDAAQMSDWICSNERFSKQSSLGLCTGFLISDRHLVTAGHCGAANDKSSDPEYPFCTPEITWYFGYQLNSPDHKPHKRIREDQMYHCKKMIRIENTIENGREGNDFAIIELDRPVKNATPLKLPSMAVRTGDPVYTIGFPMGMPMKVTDKSAVLDNHNPLNFAVNLDTQAGNSGGPVLNDRNEVVGILISGHGYDLFEDKQNSCNRFNRCDETGLKCDIGDPISKNPQINNHVQRIEFVLPYFEKAR